MQSSNSISNLVVLPMTVGKTLQLFQSIQVRRPKPQQWCSIAQSEVGQYTEAFQQRPLCSLQWTSFTLSRYFWLRTDFRVWLYVKRNERIVSILIQILAASQFSLRSAITTEGFSSDAAVPLCSWQLCGKHWPHLPHSSWAIQKTWHVLTASPLNSGNRLCWKHLKKQFGILSLQKGFLLSLSVLCAFVNLIFTNEAASTGEWAGFCPVSGTTSRTVSSALFVDFLLLGWCER